MVYAGLIVGVVECPGWHGTPPPAASACNLIRCIHMLTRGSSGVSLPAQAATAWQHKSRSPCLARTGRRTRLPVVGGEAPVLARGAEGVGRRAGALGEAEEVRVAPRVHTALVHACSVSQA
jgi:hypothetical protein